MNVIMVIMKKNNTLYIGYNECNNGDDKNKNNTLYIGYNECNNDDNKKK